MGDHVKRAMHIGDRVRWFGKPWGAPVCDDEADRDPVPMGAPCGHCGEAFGETSQGISMPRVRADGTASTMHVHLDCMLASIGVSPARNGGS